MNPPIKIPGLNGLLHLAPYGIEVVPLGLFPAKGVTAFQLKIPTNCPRVSIPAQALMGLQPSNLDLVQVK